MKIQLINYDGKNPMSSESIFTTSKFSEPKSLDEFDINIIDLHSDDLWENNENSTNSINIIEDFINLQIMIDKKQKSTVIMVFPQNTLFYYYYGYSSKHNHSMFLSSNELKNCLFSINTNIIPKLIPKSIQPEIYKFFYENTTTVIEGLEYEAAFNFISSNNILTKSRGSDKITTIQAQDGFIITTLDILTSEEKLMAFLKKCKLISNRDEYHNGCLNIKY